MESFITHTTFEISEFGHHCILYFKGFIQKKNIDLCKNKKSSMKMQQCCLLKNNDILKF